MYKRIFYCVLILCGTLNFPVKSSDIEAYDQDQQHIRSGPIASSSTMTPVEEPIYIEKKSFEQEVWEDLIQMVKKDHPHFTDEQAKEVIKRAAKRKKARDFPKKKSFEQEVWEDLIQMVKEDHPHFTDEQAKEVIKRAAKRKKARDFPKKKSFEQEVWEDLIQMVKEVQPHLTDDQAKKVIKRAVKNRKKISRN